MERLTGGTLLFAALLAFLLAQVSYCADNVVPFIQQLPLDLSSVLNIKAASTGLDDSLADFDGSRRAYPVEWLPNATTFEYNGISV